MQTQEIKVIEVGAALIFIDYNLLLVNNSTYKKYKGPYMGPPGGKKEENQSIEQCIEDETRQEIGVEAKVLELVGVSEFELPIGRFRVKSHNCKIISGTPRVCEPEKAESVKAYNLDDLYRFEEEGKLVNSLADLLRRELIQPYMIKR